MQQHRAVHRRVKVGEPHGPRPHQPGILLQSRFERRQVARNHRLHGRLEPPHQRPLLGCRGGVGGKRGPVPKVIPAGQRQLRIAKLQPGITHLSFGNVLRQPRDLFVQKARVTPVEKRVCLAIARLVGRQQRLRLLLVLLQDGIKRQKL
jgi:hypothetical protein